MAASATRWHPAIDWEGRRRVSPRKLTCARKAKQTQHPKNRLSCIISQQKGVLPGNFLSNISHGNDPVNC